MFADHDCLNSVKSVLSDRGTFLKIWQRHAFAKKVINQSRGYLAQNFYLFYFTQWQQLSSVTVILRRNYKSTVRKDEIKTKVRKEIYKKRHRIEKDKGS